MELGGEIFKNVQSGCQRVANKENKDSRTYSRNHLVKRIAGNII